MTFDEKFQKVMQADPNLSLEDAYEQICFLDWVTKENEFLTSIFPNFKKDIDKNASFMGMCVALWEDESTGIREQNIFN